MKHNPRAPRVLESGDRIERMLRLEKQLAAAPASSREYRTLSAAIRIEAEGYRKSLDIAQANATHDTKTR